MLHIAAHLSNLVKVSEHVIVRHDAGTALLRIIGLLTPDQRNEIVVELMKGLEVGEYEFPNIFRSIWGRRRCGCRRNSWRRSFPTCMA